MVSELRERCWEQRGQRRPAAKHFLSGGNRVYGSCVTSKWGIAIVCGEEPCLTQGNPCSGQRGCLPGGAVQVQAVCRAAPLRVSVHKKLLLGWRRAWSEGSAGPVVLVLCWKGLSRKSDLTSCRYLWHFVLNRASAARFGIREAKILVKLTLPACCASACLFVPRPVSVGIWECTYA